MFGGFAMNVRMVVATVGALLCIIGPAMLVPMGFSLWYGEAVWEVLAGCAAGSFLLGLVLYRTCRREEEIGLREAFAIVLLSWVVVSAVSALPFRISGWIPSFTDAYFETVSGYTATGSTILRDIEALPKGLLFWRSMTHWFGGMGIVLLSLAVLPFLGISGMRLFKAEVPGPVKDKLRPRVAETAKILWGVYLLFTVVETILLMYYGQDLFHALCHTFGTVAGGGFSPLNASIAAYNDQPMVGYIVIVFMFLAGVNFSLHYLVLKGRWREALSDTELRWCFCIFAGASVLVALDIYHAAVYDSFSEALRYATFQVVSIGSTTGFVNADYEKWPVFSQLVLLLLMFVGACAGSTSGAIKVVRIIVMFKCFWREVYSLVHPRAVLQLRLGNTVLEDRVARTILVFLLLYLATFVAGTLLLSPMVVGLGQPPSATDPVSSALVTAASAVAACLGNVGPGLSGVGPLDNFADIPVAGKWLLILMMLMGRLELFTVVVFFSPALWGE